MCTNTLYSALFIMCIIHTQTHTNAINNAVCTHDTDAIINKQESAKYNGHCVSH